MTRLTHLALAALGLVIGGVASVSPGCDGADKGISVGSGSPFSIAIVAWSAQDVLPEFVRFTTAPEEVWIFMNPGTLTLTSTSVLVNGNFMPIVNIPLVQRQSPRLFVVGFNSPPQAGTTFEVIGTDAAGNTHHSNTVIARASPFLVTNTPVAPGTFAALKPAHTATELSPPTFEFRHLAGAAAYNLVAIHSLHNGATFRLSDIPLSVVLRNPQVDPHKFTAGQSGGVVTTFSNEPLPPLANPNQEFYVWHVVALDGTGWGIGTTVDTVTINQAVASGNATSTTFASWPQFQTQ